MGPASGRIASRCAAAIVLLAGAALPASPAAGQTWVGGGASDNWSDPGNWDTRRPPVPGPERSLLFQPAPGSRTTSHQDLADPFVLNTLALRAGVGGFVIDGRPLGLAGPTSLIQDDSTPGGSRVIRSPLQIEGVVRVRARGEPGGAALTLADVSGTGFIHVVSGDVRIDRATYSGKTTVTAGTFQIGGWTAAGTSVQLHPGRTEGQGDYVIHPAASSTAGLVGTGTIGLAVGRRIFLEAGGFIAPGYGGLALGSAAPTLRVDGGIRFGDDARYQAWSTGPASTTLLDVNGLLDLDGGGDVLDFTGHFDRSATVVVAKYDNRLGEFDELHATFFGGRGGETATVSYTSEPGEGRGQVLVTVTVPEPTAALAGAVAALSLLTRPRPRRRRAAGV